MKSRYKKKICICFILLAVVNLLAACVGNTIYEGENSQQQMKINETDMEKIQSIEDDTERAAVEKELPSIVIEDFYITNTGYPLNLYHIDEDNVLWGCGRNEYGQLGQGIQDYDFHEEMLKIADNVIHVDYSQHGFVIFLTKDHKLYGMGASESGSLQQLDSFSCEQYINKTGYPVSVPVLLMENVKYAKCGRDDIAVLAEDGGLWIWGTIWYEGENYCYIKEPVKVLDDTVLITGGMYNHAALTKDGCVWTWGYNYSGNCGIQGATLISAPQLVAEDVVMVWTGTLKNNVDTLDISEFDGICERGLENTIIKKADGSYWICGAGVGSKEKVLPSYYEAVNYTMTCTHEFLPYEGTIDE